MTTDIIADMLTRIRNANLVRHRLVQVIKTNLTISVTQILKEEGYIADYEEIELSKKSYLLLSLKYYNQKRQPIITGLKRVSKPGLRIYVNKNNLPIVINNLGIAILSTSKGILTNNKAKKLGVGGEVLCYIW
uniref:Small ribosomal subunit protein uS8c n=1 Tax=Dictyopteris divaricata TaxID=156996 RepID=A0A2I4Q355_9PHAE|nr:30S ribosomal protein S8 [Dictyopteris divaricata]YP_010205344.1 30S ribosomal protein S8 [Grateloupia livida]AQZ25055.1 30S ribosomal protein S8 [Dictyopteris divaricata]UAV85913.1 30S ribosomal protein S8 [Grateloupia livida]